MDSMLTNSDVKATKQLYAKAYHLYESGRYRDALHFFRTLCVMDVDEVRHWVGLGATYQMLHDHTQALAAYGMAALLDETNPTVHLHAAECLLALKRIEECRNALSLAEQHSKDKIEFADVYSQLAIIKRECNNLPSTQPQ